MNNVNTIKNGCGTKKGGKKCELIYTLPYLEIKIKTNGCKKTNLYNKRA